MLDSHQQETETDVTLRRGRPASREIANQIREARNLQLAIQTAGRKTQAANAIAQDNSTRPGYRRFYSVADFEAKRAWVKSLPGDSKVALKKTFDQAEKLGAYRRVATAPDPETLDVLLRDFPNFSAVTEMIQRRLHLCRISSEQLFKAPPVLLDGPPGVGKTAYCKRLAGLLGIRFEQIDISSSGVDFAMAGLDAGYSTGRPGRVWNSLNFECMSVLWLLDEVDKCSISTKDSSISYLLSLMEPVTACQFADQATQLAVDATWIVWIATSNDKKLIDAPLRSRFRVFNIGPPTGEQVRAVISSIHNDMRKTEDWAENFSLELGEEVIHALEISSPREIRQRLEDAYAAAAAQQRRHLVIADIPPALYVECMPHQRIGFV